MGRPTTYTTDIAAEICSELADGKSMRTVCEQDHMPSMSTVFKWLVEHPEFSEQYAKAKEECAEAMVEDMLSIADEPASMTGDGKIDSADVAQKRLRVDTRKWIASKLKPKKYGDKVQQEVSGPDGGPVQVSTIRIVSGNE